MTCHFVYYVTPATYSSCLWVNSLVIIPFYLKVTQSFIFILLYIHFIIPFDNLHYIYILYYTPYSARLWVIIPFYLMVTPSFIIILLYIHFIIPVSISILFIYCIALSLLLVFIIFIITLYNVMPVSTTHDDPTYDWVAPLTPIETFLAT